MKLTSADPGPSDQTENAPTTAKTKMADDQNETKDPAELKNGSNGQHEKMETDDNDPKSNGVETSQDSEMADNTEKDAADDEKVKENGDSASTNDDTTETSGKSLDCVDNSVKVKLDKTADADTKVEADADTSAETAVTAVEDKNVKLDPSETADADKVDKSVEGKQESPVVDPSLDNSSEKDSDEKPSKNSESVSLESAKESCEDIEESSTVTSITSSVKAVSSVSGSKKDVLSDAKSVKKDEEVLVSSSESKPPVEVDDLKKLKKDGGLKMQLDDGETFEVQMISSGDESSGDESSTASSSRPPSTTPPNGTASAPFVINEKKAVSAPVPSKISVVSAPGTKPVLNPSSTTITIVSGASVPTVRPASNVSIHQPSILTHSQVYRDSKGNLVRKPLPLVKSTSGTNLINIQPIMVHQKATTSNEELAIEFNKKSRKKLTINNLIDALKEFGLDLEHLKVDVAKQISESKKDDKKDDAAKKAVAEKNESQKDGEKKVDEAVVKSEEKEKSVEKEKSEEEKSEKGEKEKAEENNREKDVDSEEKSDTTVDKKDDSGKVTAEEEKVDEDGDDSEVKATDSPRRSSRRSSRTVEKEEKKEKEPSKAKVDKSKNKDTSGKDEGDKGKEKEVEVKETPVEEPKKEPDNKTKTKSDEVVIESDDEKETKKQQEEEQDDEIARHGDVAKKLRPVAKFLYFTGLDFCREAVYKDLVTAQEKKHKAGKLDPVEIHDFQQMRKRYHIVRNKNRPLRPHPGRVCKRCPFATESKSALYLHHQQGHLDVKRLTWSCALCDFESRIVQTFVFHMESEHNMTAQPLPRPQFFSCSLCSYNSSTKSHMSKHLLKCEKMFVVEKHQFPLYDDINFIFRALPGPLIKVPVPQPVVQKNLQVRQVVPGATNRFVATQSNVLPMIPRSGVPPRLVTAPVARIGPNAVIPGRSRYPPQTAQQFITSTIQQMKIVPQAKAPAPTQPSQPIVIKDSPSTTLPGLKRATVANLTSTPPIKPKSAKYSYEVCEICGGFVLDRMALRLHFAMAHNINLREDALDSNRTPPLSCDFCTSRFFTFQGLSLHKARNNHARADQALCHICNTLTSDMPQHIKNAHNIVPNQLNTIRICPICGQCVLTEKTETHIERVHNIKLEKPVSMAAKPVFGCSICSAQFTERSLLSLHMRKGHPEVAASKNSKESRKCPICSAMINAGGYKKHVMVAHCRKKLKIKLSRCDDESKSKTKTDSTETASDNGSASPKSSVGDANESAKETVPSVGGSEEK